MYIRKMICFFFLIEIKLNRFKYIFFLSCFSAYSNIILRKMFSFKLRLLSKQSLYIMDVFLLQLEVTQRWRWNFRLKGGRLVAALSVSAASTTCLLTCWIRSFSFDMAPKSFNTSGTGSRRTETSQHLELFLM